MRATGNVDDGVVLVENVTKFEPKTSVTSSDNEDL